MTKAASDRIYVGCGIGMALFGALELLDQFDVFGWSGLITPTYVSESGAVLLFGVAWLLKGLNLDRALANNEVPLARRPPRCRADRPRPDRAGRCAGPRGGLRRQRAVQPPSTSTVSPVIRDAAGDARNTTTPATSIGLAHAVQAAIRSTTSAWNSGSASTSAVPGVRTKVGGDRVDRDPVPAHSTARHFVRCASAAFVMQ